MALDGLLHAKLALLQMRTHTLLTLAHPPLLRPRASRLSLRRLAHPVWLRPCSRVLCATTVQAQRRLHVVAGRTHAWRRCRASAQGMGAVARLTSEAAWLCRFCVAACAASARELRRGRRTRGRGVLLAPAWQRREERSCALREMAGALPRVTAHDAGARHPRSRAHARSSELCVPP
jgi:hypothetical protein